MSCKRWIDLLVDRSANELDEEETILLEQHLADCPMCRSEELHLGRILAPEEPQRAYRPAPDMERRIWAQWRLELGSDTGSRPQRPFWPMLSFTRRVPLCWAATATIFAILVGLWVGQRGAHPSQGAGGLPPSRPERFTPLEDSRPPVAFATIPGDAMSLSRPTPRDTL
jgi:anti-sigma factor RsiW